jgi:hypothetical protein
MLEQKNIRGADSMQKQIAKAIELANEGNWDQAHRIVQKMEDQTAYWLHANLHREEGDHGNAQYWYSRAEQPFSKKTFEAERADILTSL